jgi:hypothetical protein
MTWWQPYKPQSVSAPHRWRAPHSDEQSIPMIICIGVTQLQRIALRSFGLAFGQVWVGIVEDMGSPWLCGWTTPTLYLPASMTR